MARLILSSYHAEARPGISGTAIAVRFCTGEKDPVPTRTVEIKRAADAEREFEAYRAEVAATGKPAAISMRIHKGDRSPPGFKALKSAKSFIGVNV